MKWRTIFTDSESETGVAPECENPHTGLDYNGSEPDPHGVYGCCPHPHIETYSERIARRVVRDLNAADAGPCL